MRALPVLPEAAWLPATPAVVSTKADRSAIRYLEVLRQFDVERSARYQPRNGKTWCNVYAWDVTRAMSAEIPHWVDTAGRPTKVGRGVELSANGVFDWLNNHGAEYGWWPSRADAAELLARCGRPAVAIWKNPEAKKSGHIAMVIPGEIGVVTIAQAGKTNFIGLPVASGFGNLPVAYFAAE